MAGSLTPFWSSYFNLDRYVFTDSSGAEYRLDVNNNGVWSSKEGVYIYYDSFAKRIYFPNSSFWVMGDTVGGVEADAGAFVSDSPGRQQRQSNPDSLLRRGGGELAEFERAH